jgi:hypothetical protein
MFTDTVYNEIMWYSIFTRYYAQILSQREEMREDLRSEYQQSFA